MPNEIKESILTHFNHIGRYLRQHSMQNFGAENLTMHQIHALFFIKHHQPVRMNQMAEELCISPGSTTVLIDRLVESGWLTRTQDDHDRRSVYLEVSFKTGRKLDEILKQRMQHSSRMLDHLNSHDLAELDRILGVLQDSL